MIPFRPFQHLVAVSDQMAALRSIHRHLEPAVTSCSTSSIPISSI
jgi:hypothetical protein